MAKRTDSSTARSAHVDELFKLAQLVAVSVDEAGRLVEKCFLEVGSEDRFALLAALVRCTGLKPERATDAMVQSSEVSVPVAEPPPVEAEGSRGAGVDPEPDGPFEADPRRMDDAEPDGLDEADPRRLDQTEPDGPFEADPPRLDDAEPNGLDETDPAEAVVVARIHERERDRQLLPAFAKLAPLDRLLLALSSLGVHSPLDLGGILDCDPVQAARLLSDARSRFAAASPDKGPFQLDPDAIRPHLELVLTPAGVDLHQRIAESLHPQDRLERKQQARSSARRAISISLLLLTAVAAGLGIPRLLKAPPETVPSEPIEDVITVLSRAVPASAVMFQTRDDAEAYAWLAERTDFRFSVPDINGAPLLGAGLAEATPGVLLPVLFYGQSLSSPEVSVGVLNYAVIDRHARQLRLERDDSDALASPGRTGLRMTNGSTAVGLRHADDIYVVVSAETDVNLANRVLFAP